MPDGTCKTTRKESCPIAATPSLGGSVYSLRPLLSVPMLARTFYIFALFFGFSCAYCKASCTTPVGNWVWLLSYLHSISKISENNFLFFHWGLQQKIFSLAIVPNQGWYHIPPALYHAAFGNVWRHFLWGVITMPWGGRVLLSCCGQGLGYQAPGSEGDGSPQWRAASLHEKQGMLPKL